MRLSSTLQRTLVELPEPPGPIRMYFCGPTVYARAHIGNARPFVVGMWLRSWLRARGYEAVLVHNITDINDKIYEAAPGASAELAARATEWYLQDTGDLGLGVPDFLPRATEVVPQIVAFVEELIARGVAYEVDGDVYFRVGRASTYGELSGQRPGEMQEQEPNARKEDARDFALWKATKPGEDTAWDSPWGKGRPGWHIECSVMAEEFLGPAFEIHGGGLDLVFPHHENELAQSRALGHDFARVWMHNGLLQNTGAKMSKSEGNIQTLRDALDEWGRETILLYFMTAHWRKPIDYDRGGARAGARAGGGLPQPLRRSRRPRRDAGCGVGSARRGARRRLQHPGRARALPRVAQPRARALRSCAGSSLFGLGSLAGSGRGAGRRRRARRRARVAARGATDFAEADRLRAAIEAAGWEVRDVAADPGFQLVPRSA